MTKSSKGSILRKPAKVARLSYDFYFHFLTDTFNDAESVSIPSTKQILFCRVSDNVFNFWYNSAHFSF